MTARRAHLALALLAAFVLTTVLTTAPAQARSKAPRIIESVPFRTVPAIKGLKLRFAGGRFVRTNSRGRVSIRLTAMLHPTKHLDRYRRLHSGYFYIPPKVRPLKRADGSIVRFDRLFGATLIAVTQTYRFTPHFVRRGGSALPAGAVQSYTLKSRTGALVTVKGTSPVRLQGSRVVPFTGEFVSKDIEWAIQSVMVDGTNVVTRARQRFSPRKLHGAYEVPLLFFSAKVTSSDAIFGFPLGTSVTLTYPSGRTRLVKLSKDGTADLTGLPRGNFKIKADAPGVSPERPMALSRDQVVDLKVISYLDLALAAAVLGTLAILLLVIRRPHLRRLPGRRPVAHAPYRPELEVEPEPAEPVAT
jgi:hypothetical protein